MENATSIFSEDTLDSIAMAEIMGGEVNNCAGGNCAAGCACPNFLCGSNPLWCPDYPDMCHPNYSVCINPNDSDGG